MTVKYMQENGLRVLLEPVSDVASVSVGLWLRRGSRDERENEWGYAHFVEHMLFKGTKNLSARDIAREVDRVGGQHNAATNREYTCYYINVISEHLDLAVRILADMYYNSIFDPAEIEKEKGVIIEEIRMYEDTPDEFIHDIFLEKMFHGHPLSHSILGTIEGIAGLSRDHVYDFYRTHYREPNALFVIAGDFSVDRARDLVSASFSRPLIAADQAAAGNPAVMPQRTLLNHIERDLEQVHFCLGSEGISRTDPDRWALYALSTILGGNMSSRLFQNVRENEGLCYSIYTFHSSYSDYGIFGLYCATAPDKFRRAAELILAGCRDLVARGISDEELCDAKTYMKGNLALSFESIEVRMGQLAKSEINFGRVISLAEMMEDINNITLDDVIRVVGTIFGGKTLSLVSVGTIPETDIGSIDFSI